MGDLSGVDVAEMELAGGAGGEAGDDHGLRIFSRSVSVEDGEVDEE